MWMQRITTSVGVEPPEVCDASSRSLLSAEDPWQEAAKLTVSPSIVVTEEAHGDEEG